jgi:uncharacterized repeat protein (TIGR03803 family)
VNIDGSGFMKLTDFSSTNGGYDPRGLVFFKGRNYGVTNAGGKYNCGVIYSINADGSDFQLLHEFNGADGKDLRSALTLIDSTFFGLTFMGGSEGTGTLFKIGANGTAFEKLVDFNQSAGFYPDGTLVAHDSVLYGLAKSGGPHNKGVLFKYDLSEMSYGSVLNFNDTTDAFPDGALQLLNGRLYGLAYNADTQVIFSVQVDGTDYNRIVEKDPVTGGRYDGALIVTDSIIFGINRQGGTTDVGVLYMVNPDGTGLTRLFDFNYNIGAHPERQLLLSGDTLFGVLSVGGIDRTGGVFGIKVDGTGFFYLDEAVSNGRIASSRRLANAFNASISLDNGTLYGASTADYGLTREARLFSYDLRQANPSDPGSDPETDPGTDPVTGLLQNEALAMYPNPVTEQVRIDGLAGELVSLVIVNNLGKPLSCPFINDSVGYLLDVRPLVPGMYILQVTSTQQRYTLRFIKR